MDVRAATVTRNIDCTNCPLRKGGHFRDFSSDELAFLRSFKQGELVCQPGSTITVQGSHSAHLYTVTSGWGFRYKTLEDGRRQILNYVFPGDLVGLQSALVDEMQHSVEALSPMVLCVFERSRLFDLFATHPTLGYDVTWLAAQEEQMLDEHLLSVGRRSAIERAAYLLAFIHERGKEVSLFRKKSEIAPMTQQHVADTLGLSLVHTNKTLRKLVARHAITWHDSRIEIKDPELLKSIASWDGERSSIPRPFI